MFFKIERYQPKLVLNDLHWSQRIGIKSVSCSKMAALCFLSFEFPPGHLGYSEIPISTMISFIYQQHGYVLRSIVLDLLYISSLIIYESKGWRLAMACSKQNNLCTCWVHCNTLEIVILIQTFYILFSPVAPVYLKSVYCFFSQWWENKCQEKTYFTNWNPSGIPPK